MKAVEPTGRFRDRLSPAEIAADAEELADSPETREKTMLDRFMDNLASNPKAASLPIVARISGNTVDDTGTQVEVDRSVLPEEAADTSSYEDAMMALSEVRDDLIGRFPSVSNDKNLYGLFTSAIHRIEGSMKKLGMEVDEFNPLTSLSGLSSSDEMLVNANEVVENTRKRYTLHRIADIKAEVYRGAPSVVIAIEGDDAGTRFAATGRIVAPNDFSGNEAIDFVAKNGQCALGVKAMSLGRFMDVSDRFSIDFDVNQVEESASPQTE
jgi:hypothetical protein